MRGVRASTTHDHFLMVDSVEDQVNYVPWVVRNKRLVQHVQDVALLALGVAAGVLQLEGFRGFGLFVAGSLVVSSVVVGVVAGGAPGRYFESPLKDVVWGGLTTGVAGYVMMWCLMYALIDT